MKPILSILIPSVPSRIHRAAMLIQKLGDNPDVEVLAFLDNKRRPVGGKRQSLLEIARGDYVAFCDDDDNVADDYLAELLPRCASGPDVVTFEQMATVNHRTGRIIFDASCRADEPWLADGVARRRPWHICAWRRELALQGVFTEKSYGEDADWVNQVAPLVKRFLHVPKVLHFYHHSSETTEAPPPV